MIFLSAGHYPDSPGACFFNFCEHMEAFKWVTNISFLIRQKIHVVTVPSGVLSEKIKWINEFIPEQGDLAVEIHFNSNVNAKGCETLYCPGSVKGRVAADIIQKSLESLFPPGRGVKEAWYKMDRPGHIDYPGDIEGDEKLDAFVKLVRPPAIIVEPDFISQRDRIESNRDSACQLLAEAIIKASSEI